MFYHFLTLQVAVSLLEENVPLTVNAMAVNDFATQGANPNRPQCQKAFQNWFIVFLSFISNCSSMMLNGLDIILSVWSLGT